MKYRICDSPPSFPEYAENDAYRKFKFQFENLFDEGEIPSNKEDFDKMYVPDEEFESAIKDFLKSVNSSTEFCVGYTGIGKTTSIQYCFDLGIGTVPLIIKSFDNPQKNMVVFPTFLNGQRMLTDTNAQVNSIEEAKEVFDLPGRVASVCTELEKRHPELWEYRKKEEGRREFYEFLRSHTPRILEFTDKNFFVSEWDLISLTEDQIITKKLAYAERHRRFEYLASKLKYYLVKKYDTYERLVIILDDVETMPENFQDAIIKEYLHLFACMQNTDYPNDSDYRINLLISIRPHTYRIFRKGIKGRQYEAYALGKPIMKRKPVDLVELFKRRFDYYTSKSNSIRSVGNPDTWRECYEELMKMNRAFDGKYKSMIMNLCFMNVRGSLAEYSKIFANRFWVQGNRIRQDAFTVISDEYVFNNITVLRAIGCGDSAIFTGEYSVIPNAFYTTPTSDYSIQCLLVMLYFRKKMQVFPGNVVEYGLNAEELRRVISEWKQVLGDERAEDLHTALEYLFECKILRKSILDFDDYSTLDKRVSLTDESRLYLSRRGSELLEMLSRDSVYLEMLRECSWREYRGHESEYSKECSYALMRNGQQNAIFIDLLAYVDSLREAEESFINQEQTDVYDYQKIFGTNLAVDILFQGIEKSLRYSGKVNEHPIAKKYRTVQARIRETRCNILKVED